jgi:hypothetical protein
VLLAPERVLYPCPISRAILERCDGRRPLARIVAELATEHDAPEAAIRRDVLAMLGDLAAQGFLRDGGFLQDGAAA